MDRRKRRTRKLIDDAFFELLSKKTYKEITVQDIIDKADIGRSTFYAHFATKDNLLLETCQRLFEHIFVKVSKVVRNHKFKSNKSDLEYILIHILYHIYDNKDNLRGILFSGDVDIFTIYFNDKVRCVFSEYMDLQKESESCNAPMDYINNYLIHSFVESIRWWLKKDAAGDKYSPEEIVECYLSVTCASKQAFS